MYLNRIFVNVRQITDGKTEALSLERQKISDEHAKLHEKYGRDRAENIYRESDKQTTPGPMGPYAAGEEDLAAPHPAILNAICSEAGAEVTKAPALPEAGKEALSKVQ